MIRVKICGVTRAEDALAAAEAGTDAVGFVFWPGSPRYVRPFAAARISRALPPLIARVGVFVDMPAGDVRAIRELVGLTAVQLHGDETPEQAARLPGPVIKAFRGAVTGEVLARYPVAGWLIDGAAPGAYGGSGRAANADAAATLAGDPRFILAGGLTPETVGAACRRFRPAAVDVASGVERAPGVKDHARLRRFVAAVRAASDSRASTAGEATRRSVAAEKGVG